jgi:dienelactone hydrolase
MAANFRMAQGQFQYPGLARSLASYCADDLVFSPLHFAALGFRDADLFHPCRLPRELSQEAAENAWSQMQAWFKKYNVLG